MRTLRQLQSDAKKLGLKLWSSGEGFYRNAQYGISPPAVKKKDHWGYEYEDVPWGLDCTTEQAVFSCGVGEVGAFNDDGNEAPPPEIAVDAWQLLLEYVVRKEKTTYLRAITTNKIDFEHVNLALPKAGFVKRGETKSRHGDYPIYIWEWTA